MIFNKPQNYIFFMVEGMEFYQWRGIGPNGAFVKNWGSKKWDQIRAIPVPVAKCHRISYFFFYSLLSR